MTNEEIVKACSDMKIGESREFPMNVGDRVETIFLTVKLGVSRNDVNFVVNRSGKNVTVSCYDSARR